MTFSEFAEYLKKLEETSSRLKITEILSDLYKKATLDEIDKICYLSLGILAPNYKSVVFNLAEKMMLQAIAKAYGRDSKDVTREYKEKGDLGIVAESLSKSKSKTGLNVLTIYENLLEIARDEGEKSVERKIGQMAELLERVDPLSARFIARIPVGKLRLGFSDKTILDALSWMETGGKSKSKTIEEAYVILPDVGILARSVKEKGIERTVKNVKPIVGIPVLPMLAQRLKSPAEMIKKMGKVFVEPKFDGLRVLVHFKRGKFIKAFTRNSNDVTEMFPELQRIGEILNCDEAILDSEAVGMDPEMKRLLDFQTTMKRRRVHQIDLTAKAIPLSFQVFDVISCDGVSFMDKPYFERRKVLEKIVRKGNKLLVLDETLLTQEPEVINREYRKNIKLGLEGVIVKKYDANYVPGRTGWRWVKMKQEEASEGKLSDTVDCIVMGYTVGKGKRASFGLGQFLVGVISNTNGKSKSGRKILTLTKIGTGLSDVEFRSYKKLLEKEIVKEMPKEYEIHKNYTPDFWVNPKFVVELAGDDLTESPIHTSGYALRFPRLVKFRADKGVNEATTLSEIKTLFKLQNK
ncbi:MAG TPA: ATP-dependent DNA ligase [Patescibacteria group bacterium]|nr:ATP-dependent DNA ligase [Patescibacteria group bacterium]